MPPVLRGASACLLAALAALALACTSGDPPPRSPLADHSTPASGEGTPRPLPTFSPTTTPPAAEASPTATPAAEEEAERERVVGEAIARLAEWTGVPETEISVLSAERTDWPSACLGAPRPDEACAEVVTPGFQVRLAIRGWEDGQQVIHSSLTGSHRWWPQFGSRLALAGVDAARATVDLGEVDIIGGESRVVPGTYLPKPLAEFEAGDLVDIGLAYGITGRDGGLIVWMIPVE